MSLSRPHENEKKFFIQELKHLINSYPHLTLQETINLSLRKLDQEKIKFPNYTKLKKWIHPIANHSIN